MPSQPADVVHFVTLRNPLFAVFSLVVAALLTLPAALLFLSRYRRAVLRSMMASVPLDYVAPSARLSGEVSGARYAIPGREGWDDGAGAPAADPGPLPLALVDPEAVAKAPLGAAAAALEARVTGAARRALWAYVAAGAAWAVYTGVAYLRVNGFELFPFRTASFILIHLWPLVLALFLAFPDRSRRPTFWGTVVGGFVLLAVLATLARGSVSDGFTAWAITMLPPTVTLLPFLHRSLRAVGPLVLTALWLFVFGGFVAYDLTLEFLYRATESASALGTFWKTFTTALVAALGFAIWRGLVGIARLYERRLLSDQTLLVDAVYLVFTFWTAAPQVTSSERPLDGLWLGLAFVVYRFVAWLGLRGLPAAARRERPLRLLLLRVFGDARRSERLYADLGASWRYAGSAQLIAGTDLAAATIEPYEFLDFLAGRLSRRFVKGPADLSERLARLDLAPGPDGRYRVNEFFCHDDTWQGVLLHLVTESDVVLMDLRSFSPQRQGCVFELHRLIDLVPVGRVILLVDQTTDVPFLRSVLEEGWAAMAPDSPNRRRPAAGDASPAALRLVTLSPNPSPRAARTLTALLCDAATR